MITRCVCHDVTFAALRAIAGRAGARTLAELMAAAEFGRRCTLCHPYVERMLATGRTEFALEVPPGGAAGAAPAGSGEAPRRAHDARPGAGPRAAVSWSGGKDSCLALHRARAGFEVEALITMLCEDGSRSRSHGLRPEILHAQAGALGLELLTARGSWTTYEAGFKEVLRALGARGVTHAVFGDILLDEHRAWVERVCGECGLEAVEPLWREPTADLLGEFLDAGGEALIVAVSGQVLDPGWLGRPLAREILPELARLGVDPCGEYGEYHTLVTSWPAFRAPLRVRPLERSLHGGYWHLDLALEKER